MSDKKPWEETWRYDDVHVLMGGSIETVEARERLATAAPDMARALLASGRTDAEFPDSAWHTNECWDNGRASCEEQCTQTRTALQKAGILP